MTETATYATSISTNEGQSTMITRVLLPYLATAMLLLGSAVVGCSTVADDAQAASFSSPDPAALSWVQEVQAYTHVPGPAGPTIDVRFEPVPGTPEAGGGWTPWTSTIYMSEPLDRTLEHEIGHAFDARNLDDDERAYLVTSLGYQPGTPWENLARWEPGGDLYCLHIDCPDERFADAYMGCALGLRLAAPPQIWRRWRNYPVRAWWSTYGWTTSRARYAATCAAIHDFADVPNI